MGRFIKRQQTAPRKENSPPGIASARRLPETYRMPTRRTVRVAEVLRKELSACMSQSLDLEGQLITISSVELPPDMKQAYIYVSTLNPEVELATALKLLNRNRTTWQSTIGRRLGLKFTPQLHFRFDQAIERGDRVMNILTQIERDQQEDTK
jgi:ribosome-binding factor A